MLKLYNTLSRKIEIFKPLKPDRVTLYTCGPTVYDFPHIGNWRTYVFADTLRRTLEYNNFRVKQVMNITDVGHLTSDADEGEDKLEKGARREGKTPLEIARFYEDNFVKGLKALNILKPQQLVRASDHIKEMIILNQVLEKKGFAYQTKQALYFDIAKFSNYARLSKQNLDALKTSVRQEVAVDPEKRRAADFALWIKRTGRHKNHLQNWDSPWGNGFPGWHLECSALSLKYLANAFQGDKFKAQDSQTIDIHTGGVDHINTHHTNEIAQSEAAANKQFVKYWLHAEFLMIENKKVSKSLKNFFTLEDLLEKGVKPLALRYLFFSAHYRNQLNFTWPALESAQAALCRLYNFVSLVAAEACHGRSSKRETVSTSQKNPYRQQFVKAVNSDLNLPQALAVVWDLVKADQPNQTKLASLLEFDKILGLELNRAPKISKPLGPTNKVKQLIEERDKLRKQKKWARADAIRQKLEKLGWLVKDTPAGPRLRPNPDSSPDSKFDFESGPSDKLN